MRKFNSDYLLSNNQMKNIHGGLIQPGSCAWEGGDGYAGVVGTNKAYAEGNSNLHGGNWCCDSCCDATWLSPSHKGYLGCEGYSEYPTPS